MQAASWHGIVTTGVMKKTSVDKREIKSEELRSVKLLKELGQKELSRVERVDPSLGSSDTDEDEDEGIGDGTIHRRDDDPFTK